MELLRFALLTEKLFKMPHRHRSQQRIRTNVTNLRRNVFKYEDLIAMLDGVDDQPISILAWTAVNAAFHFRLPLSNGVAHLGCFGS